MPNVWEGNLHGYMLHMAD